MEITKRQQGQINKIAKKYGLKLVVIFGSQASGKTHNQSDLDIGVLGQKKLELKKIFQLGVEFQKIFRELKVDVRSLHVANPVFLRQVMDNSQLIYGNHTDYHRFQSFAYKNYMDSKKFFELRDFLIAKKFNYLKTRVYA